MPRRHKKDREEPNAVSDFDERIQEARYFHKLNAVKDAIIRSDVKSLRNTGRGLDGIQTLENRQTLQKYYQNPDNPFFSTNVIIFTCRLEQFDVLNFLLSKENFAFKLYEKIGFNFCHPDNVDGNKHNAFYYAIRSSNVEILDALAENWIGYKFSQNKAKLEELISKSYDELRLKNVSLTPEMEISVEKRLLELRFFCEDRDKDVRQQLSTDDVISRFDYLIEKIDETLNSVHLFGNMVFLYKVKFIAQNIHVLKRLVQSTFDSIPWEETEYFLAIYLRIMSTNQEMNMIYASFINKKKLVMHLKNLVECLKSERHSLLNKPVGDLKNMAKIQREDALKRIISVYPFFQELYEDYEKCRDVHSLDVIRKYTGLTKSANVQGKNGRLVIMRSLQMIGEYSKNTLMSPKMSDTTSEMILAYMGSDSRKTVADVRNSISHSLSLFRRMDLEEDDDSNFFQNIQNDLRRVDKFIKNVLFFNIFQVIKKQLKLLSKSEDPMEIKEILRSTVLFPFRNAIISLVPSNEPGKLDEMIDEMSMKIINPTVLEGLLMNKIKLLAERAKGANMVSNRKVTEAITAFITLGKMCSILNDSTNSIKSFRFEAEYMLNKLSTEKRCVGKPHNSQNSLNIALNMIRFLNSARDRLPNSEFYDVIRVGIDIIYYIGYQMNNLGAIEDFRYELKNHNRKFTKRNKLSANQANQNQSKPSEPVVFERMMKKFEDLRNIMGYSKPTNFDIQSLLKLKNDEQTLSVIEMLSMDILSFIGSPMENRLSDDLFSIEMYTPTMVGKSLRNHLAHGYDTIGFLTPNPANAIILNASMFAQRNIIETTPLIGQSCWNEVKYLRKKDAMDMGIIECQQQLIRSLIDGDLENIKHSVLNGADFAAKDADSMTALHFAAMSKGEVSLPYVLERWTGPVNVRNFEGQNPFHIAAIHGNLNNLKLLLRRDKTLIHTKDYSERYALHYAAWFGNVDAINLLLQLKASTDAFDCVLSTPLNLALFNNQEEAAKILLKYYKPNRDKIGGYSALHVAAEAGSVELVQYLLLQGENPEALTVFKGTPIHLAAFRGHTEIVKALIAKGANVETKTSDGGTPLLFAVEANNKYTVRILIQNGADVNANNEGFSPIFHAVGKGNKKMTELLLEENAQINIAVHNRGWTPLHHSVSCGDNAEVTELLLRHKAIISAKDDEGSTPLHHAAGNGHLASTSVLLNYGAETNIADQNGRSPIFYAAEQGQEDILKLLIDAGSIINTADIKGLTPLHLACWNGHTGVIEILANKGAVLNGNLTWDHTPLQIAVINGYGKIVDFLVAKGANVNQESKLGLQALHDAAANGDTNIINCLIKAGAKVNAVSTTPDCYTPLHMACIFRHTEASALLIRSGSHIDAKLSNGRSPLHIAVSSKPLSGELVKMLVGKGATVDQEVLALAVISGCLATFEMLLSKCHKVQEMSGSLLMVGCLKRQKSIIKLLLKRGVDANAKWNYTDKKWITPLQYAAGEGDKGVVNLLIQHGAKTNSRGFNGEIPLHKVARLGHSRAALALLAHKSDILAKDANRRTPLDLAIANGHTDIVKMFLQHDENIDVNRPSEYWGLPLLQVACHIGNLNLVKLLVEEGADVNFRYVSGCTAIHIAARDGFSDIVDYFLSKNVDMYVKGESGRTILHYIALGEGDESKRIEVAEMLIVRKHMDINVIDNEGLSPLHAVVSFSNDISLVEFFLKHGAYFNSKDHIGRKPVAMSSNPQVRLLFGAISKLFYATRQGLLKSVIESITEGAILDAKNKHNDSPLIWAAWKGQEEIANVLLMNKANPNIVGKSGSTALHYAAKSANHNIIKSLLGTGANFEVSNDVGKVPLDYASRKNSIYFLKLIRDLFIKVKRRDKSILKYFHKIKWKSGEVKALLNCVNNEGKTLMSTAILADFPNIKRLKMVFVGQSQLERIQKLCVSEKYQEGIDAAWSELKTRQLEFSRRSLMNTDLQNAIAEALYKLQRYAEAFKIFTDIEDTFREMLGDDNKHTLSMRMSIGLVMHRQGRNEEALDIFKIIDDKHKALLDPHDCQALRARSYKAMVLERLGNFDEALEINNEVLAKYKRIYGRNHPMTLVIQNNIAIILNDIGRHDEALELYSYVYEKRVKVLGPKHADTMRTKANMATVYFSQNKLDEGMKVNKEALDSQKSVLNACDRDLLRTKINMVMASVRNGDDQESLKLIQELRSTYTEFATPDTAGPTSDEELFMRLLRSVGDDSTGSVPFSSAEIRDLLFLQCVRTNLN